jgi:aminoglycoside phosphotransferase (APT) family kinase protein
MLKDDETLIIDAALAQRLVANQFPQWNNLPVRPVTRSGWDNRTFHLGENMLIRIPSSKWYAAQVEKEQLWLPKLAPHLPLPIPVPVALGDPGEEYPWKWSIYKWLEGETAASANINDLCDFATCLAQFLRALQNIDATDGPMAGQHSFYRGGPLLTYDAETRRALAVLKDKIDVETATEVWETALATSWQGPPVWVHGDISAGNLLIENGRLSAVIDFGQLAVGDPACDMAIAWTMFEGKSREVFRQMLPLDAGTWARGRAWTLWKALIIAAGLTDSNASEAAQSLHIIHEVLNSH